MKKLLTLSFTVLLSVYIVLVGLDTEEGYSIYCNTPAQENILGEDSTEYSVDELNNIINKKEPLTDWNIVERGCLGVCAKWRAVRWMDYVTCVETQLIKGSDI